MKAMKLVNHALLGLALSAGAGLAQAQQCQSTTPVWADEFNGAGLDTTKWEAMVGDGCSYGICGWGNNELQYYQADNASVANGVLTITAKKERVQAKKYTSARLRTANMPNGGQWTNGRFEARMKLPNGTGMWPAFWMLPTDPAVGWPESGEIDIMEATGQADMFVFGTLHYGQPYPNNEWTSNRLLKQPDAWSDGFHTYAVEWDTNEMRWYVDDLLYSVKRPEDLGNPAYWTFENYQYHFLLNLAVGGNIGGTVDDSMLPQTLQVDYVRVYDFGQPSLTGEHIVEPGSTHSYSVIDEAGTGSSYNWTLPAGATLVSGGNGATVTVQWGSNGGDLSVAVSNSCGSRDLALNVHVAPALSQSLVHDNFDTQRNLAYTSWTGTFNQSVSNPAPNAVNGSATVAQYTRDSGSLYDVIAASTGDLANVADYLTGQKAFYLDVYTSAPVGTELLLQLENSATATASNYPTGRHSKYIAHTTSSNAWQRLKFVLEDRIDGATGDTQVDTLVVLIDPNSNTGDTYFLDNLDTYAAGSQPPAQGTSVQVQSVTTGTAGAGKGKKYGTATVTLVDELGNPVSGATVTGDFSGTLSETNASAVSDATGSAQLQTSQSASGGVSVNFCVRSVSHPSLSFDSANSVQLCP